MKTISILLLLVLSSISNYNNPKLKDSYELKLLDAYEFRRNYFGHENLSGEQLDSFMNRNPVQSDRREVEKQGPLYSKLVEHRIIINKTLNLRKLNSLPDSFTYDYSKKKKLNVKVDYFELIKGQGALGYILTFRDNDRRVLKDTLEFDFPPDVSFSTIDLNSDGKDEIITLYRYYAINGDNFELKVYGVQ